MRPTSQGDSAIFVLPSEASQWVVAKDHVNDVTVERGSMVEPGVILGTVVRLGNGRGRTELQFGTQAFNELPVAAARRINGSATVCAASTVVP